MTVIAHGAITDAGSMVLPRRPRVGSQNLFRKAGVTTSVSAALAAAPKELAYNGFTYDGWMPGSTGTHWIRASFAGNQTANYMGIAAHNLAGATLTPQRSSDGSAWTNILNAYVAVDNRPIVFEWADTSFPHYRLEIQNTPAGAILGVINCGAKLTMDRGLPVGWKPPSLNELKEYTNTISEGGQILGRQIIRKGAEVTIDASTVSFLWARDSWEAFISEAESYGFFMWWAATEGRGEIVYGGLESHEAQFNTYVDVACKFKMRGINR